MRAVHDSGLAAAERMEHGTNTAFVRVLRPSPRAAKPAPRTIWPADSAGKQFAIPLPHTREADALDVAEKIRGHIGTMTVPVVGGAEWPCATVTISVRVAALDGDATNELGDMLAAADATF